MPGLSVYAGTHPPTDRTFDWVTSPAARVSALDAPLLPTLDDVEGLIEQASPVLDAMCEGRQARWLRDEVTGLVRNVAVLEIIRRAVGEEPSVRILAERSVARPSVIGDPGGALAALTNARVDYTRGSRAPLVPTRAVSMVRTVRQVDVRRARATSNIQFAIGGPSEARALSSVLAKTAADHAVFGFAAGRDPSVRASLPIRLRDTVRPIDHASYLDKVETAWKSVDWWGGAWFPHVRRSLRALSVVTLRDAVDHYEAATRLLRGARALVTAKVRWAPARAIVSAATDLGIPSVGIQHGLYRDSSEWQDVGVDVYATAGHSFASILESRGYRGEIEVAGAPYFQTHDKTWDCVIALRPPEGHVIASEADYIHHATAMYGAARRAMPAGSIGFRLHPRESEVTLRSIVGPDVMTTRDPKQGGKVWLAVESSAVADAAMNGAVVVLAGLNGHEWQYPFSTLPGVAAVRSEDELEAAVQRATRSPDDGGGAGEWRRLYGKTTGAEAGKAIAAIVERVAS